MDVWAVTFLAIFMLSGAHLMQHIQPDAQNPNCLGKERSKDHQCAHGQYVVMAQGADGNKGRSNLTVLKIRRGLFYGGSNEVVFVLGRADKETTAEESGAN